MKLQVFLSSAMTGELSAERIALRTLFAHANYLSELVDLFAIEDHASSREIEAAYLEEVAAADLVVVLLGTELRDAVVKEFDHAEKCGKRMLCYIAGNQQPTSELKAFISERAYSYHAARFSDHDDLVRRVRTDFVRVFVHGFRGTAQGMAKDDSSESYLIKEVRTPYASSSYFAPADVHEILSKPEFADLSANQLVALASLHLEESGNYLGSLLLLEAAILLAPDNWMALSNRGMVLEQMGLFHYAQLSYQSAAALSPENASIQYNLGICHYTSRDYDRALQYFKKSLEIEPDKPSAVSRIAATYLQIEDADAAIEWATRSLQLDPSEINTANMALALGLAGRRSEAIQHADRLKGDPARIHELKAFIECRSGNHAACIAEVDAYAALAPASVRAASLKYESLIALDRKDDAIAYFVELEGSHLLMPCDYNNYGYQHMVAFGPSDFAENMFRKAVSRDPSCMPYWHNLQHCLGEMGKYDETILACNDALQLNPLDQNSIYNKALCLRQLGRITELAMLMAEKTGDLLGPITGETTVEFVEKMKSSPLGQCLGAFDDLAKIRQERSRDELS
ncbi:MAG: tetratricopeptide repeat protein [Phycisphaerales bacterium]